MDGATLSRIPLHFIRATVANKNLEKEASTGACDFFRVDERSKTVDSTPFAFGKLRAQPVEFCFE